MIGDYVTPCNGIPPQAYRQWSRAKNFCRYYTSSKLIKQLKNENNHYHRSYRNDDRMNCHDSDNKKQCRRLMFSSPISKLHLSSSTRIFEIMDNLHQHNDNFYSTNSMIDKLIKFGWNSSKNYSYWDARSNGLRTALLSDHHWKQTTTTTTKLSLLCKNSIFQNLRARLPNIYIFRIDIF